MRENQFYHLSRKIGSAAVAMEYQPLLFKGKQGSGKFFPKTQVYAMQ